ncbi:MAG: hypothetical protein HY241_02455 [Actinobacteria bacterium]|nr:hypothetical protein [Actinomycetota bacterium]
MSVDGFGRIWRWPLYTPRRFFSVLLSLLILIALSNMIFGKHGGVRPPGAAAAAGPAATTAPTVPPGSVPGDTPTIPVVEPPLTVSPLVSPQPAGQDAARQVADTATAFTRAWADHTRPVAQWLAQVTSFADPEFAAQLQTTDPANVPANAVTGAAQPVVVNYASASVEVPTDAGVVVVVLVNDGRRWLVTDIRPKR